MAKRIDIGLPNQLYKRIEELAASAELKPTEVARLSLRHTLADPQGFLTWLNGGVTNRQRQTQEHAV
jgi:hypothetical protein